jgi:hypothetical protein
MEFIGRLEKSDGWYCSFIDSFDAYSQGKTKKQAIEMLIDAIHELAHAYKLRPPVLEIAWIERDSFGIRTGDSEAITAFIVRRCRKNKGESLRSLAAAVGTKGVNTVRQYETGEHAPSIAKFEKLLDAMGKTMRIEIVDKAH